MGFDFIVIAPLLPSHCGFSFVFGCGVSFMVRSSVLLSSFLQQLVVILVLSQEGVYLLCSISCTFALSSVLEEKMCGKWTLSSYNLSIYLHTLVFKATLTWTPPPPHRVCKVRLFWFVPLFGCFLSCGFLSLSEPGPIPSLTLYILYFHKIFHTPLTLPSHPISTFLFLVWWVFELSSRYHYMFNLPC